ncbi:MAG TPA: serine/threonine-protein kinase [Polyangiaceae bacterium]
MMGSTPDEATRRQRPVSQVRSRTATTGPRHTWSDRGEDADAEERRQALPKMFGFVLVGWLLFGLLDVYIALVVAPSTPRGWMAGWRLVGAVPPLVGWLLTRKHPRPSALSTALEVGTFVGMALCVAMRATRYGGLDSHIMPGISLMVMVQTMAVPSRWQRSLPMAVATYAVYPVVMALAALRDATIAAQWHGHEAAVFVQDYGIVAACALGGVVGGNIIWGMRRQLYYARRLGRYRLKARIGHGGSSEVWLAWDDALRRDVALKILDRSVSGDSMAITRFEREAMAASGLQSPHTIRVFDFGASDDGVWFMAMEHLEGLDLATLVDDVGPLPPARAVRFARQACAALSEAHDAGVVHRDVKPDNLFVCRMGDEPDFLKVLDFGIAKIEGAEEDASVTRAGWVHGTPAYMAPEVCNGGRADPRSDVYSLGSVLYFLLTGTPPFTAPTAAAVMVAHVNDVPEPPSRRAPVPADIERVVLRCLEKEPEDRYQSARELDMALAECKDAGTWTRDLAEANRRASGIPRVRPAIASRPGPLEEVDEQAATRARPSVPGGMKLG